MRHRAEGGDAVELFRQHGGGARKSRDVARPRRHQPGFGAMRTAQPEIDQQLARRRQHHPRSLGSNQRLEVQDIDETRLGQLRLRQRCGDAQDRLVAEEHRSFRHRMDVAGEMKIGELSEQFLSEAAGSPEPADVLGREAQIFEKIERLFEASRNQKAASGWKLADEEFENRRLGLAVIQVGLEHVELIEVGQQRRRRLVHGTSPARDVLEASAGLARTRRFILIFGEDLHNVRDLACQSASLLGKNVTVARSPDNRFLQFADGRLQVQNIDNFGLIDVPDDELEFVFADCFRVHMILVQA